jgi:UDP-GlcNAc:undecaprenyl-phosphate GlcNAc-1-phosphate transferase
LIYGAGDGGELLLRELLNNRALKYSPVGFLDDDPAKSGKVIHGLRVYGGNGDLTAVCKQHNVDEVLISSTRMTEERLLEIVGLCRTWDIQVKRMRITIEDLADTWRASIHKTP